MTPPPKTWKATERNIARQLGTHRIGPGHDRADCRTHNSCIEIKHRKEIPAWLKGALAQAKKYARPGQLAIAVIHEAGSHDSLVVMSFKDYVEWYGAVEVPEGEIMGEGE